MAAADDFDDVAQILDQAVDAGPQAAIGGPAEAALIVGVSGDAARRLEGGGLNEGI